jgi:hypothetical protein
MRWTVALREREPPLPPAGVVATGAAGERLRAAARRWIECGAELRAAEGDGWLLLLGDDLPWADGCVYVGHEGPLLLPTTRAIDPPADLVAAAVGPAGVIVVLPDAILRGPMPVRTAAL